MIIRRTNCQKNKEITYDTVVVGGGIAGVSAAASAAKNGSKTLLIESATFSGWRCNNGTARGINDAV